MATGGYVDFARSWARGLDLINVSHYLVAALDDVALSELKPLGGHVVPVYDEAFRWTPRAATNRRPTARARSAR